MRKSPGPKKLKLAATRLRNLSLAQVSGARIPIPTDPTYSFRYGCNEYTYFPYCR